MAPRISIVTPSFNQAAYLPETIQSVLSQNYPNLEYLIMDGGSTDASPDIIRNVAPQLAHWSSAPDGGQAAAINSGFARATGDIFAWLNSDDFYHPGALAKVAALLPLDRPTVLVGNCLHFQQGTGEKWGSSVPEKLRHSDLRLWDFIEQPSAFWNRAAWLAVGPVDESLSFTFDWDWFIRAQRAGIPFLTTPEYLSAYRYHDQHKTSSGDSRRQAEIRTIYGRYAGPSFHDALERCFNAHPRLKIARKAVRRLRLDKWHGRIFRTCFPHCFRGFADNDIRDVLECLG